VQGYTAELAVSAIISSWHRGNAERTDNRWLVPHGGENRCRNSFWKLSNPLQRLDFFTSNVAINRLVAHFLFGKPLDYDDMRESTKTAPDSAILATRESRHSHCANSREWGRNGKQPLGDV